MRRNLVQSLIEHGRIRTTLPKAREIRRFAERLVTLAVDGGLAARQRAIAMLNDRAIIAREHRDEYERMSDAKRAKVLSARSGRRYRASTTRPGVKFTAESVIHRLFSDLGPRFRRRAEKRGPGGYTRIIKLAERRLGDAGDTALLEFVGEDEKPRKKGSDRSERKRRAKARYALYAGKPMPRRGGRRTSREPSQSNAPQAEG
jgi:large subunit ribosomal protein L17